jgi:hypothetical protein
MVANDVEALLRQAAAEAVAHTNAKPEATLFGIAAAELAALRAERDALSAERETALAQFRWAGKQMDECAKQKEALRARVAELERERDEAVNWIFGDDKTTGLLDTVDGYYEWHKDPRAKRLDPKRATQEGGK